MIMIQRAVRMKKFLIRTCNVIVIVAALMGYNHVAKAHEAQDAEAKAEADAANAEVEAALAEIAGEETVQSAYTDGVYQGTATGFGGDITVEVTVEDGQITNLTIVSAENEDGAYLTMAEDIIDAILEAQSTDVDTISGATFSSTGIKNAAAEALAAAQ
ncbi:MAG: FMN-binding protein [Lachnospiraceae bacterium]|nr:FMN-binding protein [Lachnospiraceae bacterium]